nr:translation initiation factor IF-2-like isoform X4 [Saimiri boliviensis boliviensis]
MSAICKWPRAVSRCLPSWSPLLPRSSDPAAALAWGPAPPQRSAAQRSVSGRRGPRARSQRPAAGFPEQKPAGSRDGPQDGEGHHRPRVRQEPVGLGPRHPQPQGGRAPSGGKQLGSWERTGEEEELGDPSLSPWAQHLNPWSLRPGWESAPAATHFFIW